MITFASPSTLYDIRPGHTGFTEEWGRIKVIRKRGGTVWFEASGGRGKPNVFHTLGVIYYTARNGTET